jgi:pimeloyl-ACP methyl ester carboxylesterase
VTTASQTGRTSGGLAYDIAGDGDAVVLVHAGIADRRMWESQWAALGSRHRVVRYDARGFGDTTAPTGPWSHHQDLEELMAELGIARAHLVGCSMGAGTAVEVALARPAIVRSLVLAAPGGALYEAPPEALRAVWRLEADALDRGDLAEAVELNLRTWLDGPSRTAADVDPDLRAFVGAMQRRAFELPAWDEESVPEQELEPPASGRLVELAVPIMAIVGELDQPATIEVAERLAPYAPRCRLVRWPDVAHLPSLERPDEFTRVVLDFLHEVGP